jgi:hypothetical protein
MKNIFCSVFLLTTIHAFSQSGSEIFLFDLKVENGQLHISNGKNITNHKGYDNQPSFHPSQPVIYYSSFNDSGRSDIKTYNFETAATSNFTTTREREYSPTVTPDGKFISCIIQRDNGDQDLAKYPIEGGKKPVVLINLLKVGYHAWAGDNKVLLFVLDDSTHFSLHNFYLDTNADTVVAENIGRSLHKIPGQNAMSFLQKVSDKNYVIKKYDMSNGVISTIIDAIPEHDQICWLENGTILTSDGKKIYSFQVTAFSEVKDRKWTPVIVDGDASILKGVTRLATNLQNTKLAVVVAE